MQLEFDVTKIENLFREVGLYNPKNEFYNERVRKHRQILDYLVQFKAALSKLSAKRPIVMVDCGCGKSYLSFLLYEYCRSVLKRKVKILGIDHNPVLIEKCAQTAKNLNFDDMYFCNSTVGVFNADEKVDIVYSLHACNTATDQTLAKGIELEAKYIFSVSCCQHANRNNMINHPLKSITRHQPYKERLVDMIGDSMRGLLLEHLGYAVKIFEYVAAEFTPKNIMLRGIKGAAKKIDQENAMANYKHLTELFNFSPALEEIIRSRL